MRNGGAAGDETGAGAGKRTMKAVERTSPKFISWAAACRGFAKPDSILGVCVIASGTLGNVVMRSCCDSQELLARSRWKTSRSWQLLRPL